MSQLFEVVVLRYLVDESLAHVPGLARLLIGRQMQEKGTNGHVISWRLSPFPVSTIE